jgi:hypothetical protein
MKKFLIKTLFVSFIIKTFEKEVFRFFLVKSMNQANAGTQQLSLRGFTLEALLPFNF